MKQRTANAAGTTALLLAGNSFPIFKCRQDKRPVRAGNGDESTAQAIGIDQPSAGNKYGSICLNS